MTTSQTSHPVSGAPSLRSGAEYLRSLNNGRQVFVDGERVADVTKHTAFS
jgi:4-hydroxyphenylacetate 3-monooxygenase